MNKDEERIESEDLEGIKIKIMFLSPLYHRLTQKRKGTGSTCLLMAVD